MVGLIRRMGVCGGKKGKVALLVSALIGLSVPNGGTAGSRPPAPSSPPVNTSAADFQGAFARVAQSIKPSVVSITAVHVEDVQVVTPEFFFGDPFEDFFNQFQGRPAPRRRSSPRHFQRRSQGLGSGVVIDSRGYVLTNAHVVRGADELTVTFQSPEEKKFSAKVVGADVRSDLAVLKIIGKGAFPAASLGDSDRVRVGDWAIAVGSPFGLEQTVTAGIISAVRQSLNIEGAVYQGMLQTDAAINRGNSGGPLVNLTGEVVGINSAIYAPTGVFAGIGFAIPSNRAKDIMAQLIEKGRVVRGWMGVEIIPLNEVLSRQFGVEDGKGVLINRVVEGSPAAAAGLERGDVIVRFNGRDIADQAALLDVVGQTSPKTKVDVKVLRSGKPLSLSLVTGETPSLPEGSPEGEGPEATEPAEESGAEWEGARLMAASPALAERYGFSSSEKGVVVVSVAPGGMAEAAGLVEGDLVRSVNRVPVHNTVSFVKTIKKVGSKGGFVFDVFRRGRWIYLSYKPD